MLERLTGSFLFMLTLTGCSSAPVMRNAMDTWIGHPVKEAIHQWGAPSGETQIAGQRYLTWTRTLHVYLPTTANSTVSRISPSYSLVQTTISPGGMVSGTCNVHLQVGHDQIIRDATFSGNDCCVMTVAGYCGNLPRRSPSSPMMAAPGARTSHDP